MTDAPKIDTTRKAVERLAEFHGGVAKSYDDHLRGPYTTTKADHMAVAATLRAFLAERDLAAAQTAAAVERYKANEDALRNALFRFRPHDAGSDATAQSRKEAWEYAKTVLAAPRYHGALDRLIAERVREAVMAEREACAAEAEQEAAEWRRAGVTDGAQAASIIARRIRARGSKEGQDA